MIVYGLISNFGGLIGFKLCSWVKWGFGIVFWRFGCVNGENICYSRSGEQGLPRRKYQWLDPISAWVSRSSGELTF